MGLVEVLRESGLPPNTNYLLLVDQFEEIFAARQEGAVDESDAFVALLLATAAQTGLAYLHSSNDANRLVGRVSGIPWAARRNKQE